MTRTLMLAVLSTVLAGCSLRAPYHPPETPPAVVRNAESTLFAAQSYDARWWRQFDDPVIAQLE
ncbi:MAG TPA: hypothetical protein VF491_25970, partial [Vicinamibacterales bacterium]